MENKILSIIDSCLANAGQLTEYERQTFGKVLSCRTEKVPRFYSRCDCCGKVHPVYKSCRNRMCPVCNGASSVKWLARREAELLPTSYFLATYTIPKELRPIFLANKKRCYNLLFRAVSRSLIRGIEKGHRSFGGKAGFFAVLHTWDQRLNYHPHLHVVIPGGCLSEDKSQWVASPKTFLLPVKRMSRDFRNKLVSLLKKDCCNGDLHFPAGTNPESLFNNLQAKEWVVNVQAPGRRSDPRQMIRYLSRYVKKTAVSEKRIHFTQDGRLALSYFDRKKKVKKTELLTKDLFFRRLCFHILPKGFKKVRFYGFMANRYRKRNLTLCRFLLGWDIKTLEETAMEEDTAFLFWKYFGVDITLCPDCGKGHVYYYRIGDRGG